MLTKKENCLEKIIRNIFLAQKTKCKKVISCHKSQQITNMGTPNYVSEKVQAREVGI
uniref:Uncharacterized protein n=1 Tax=Rhizophora mucronata TaxID=61149 RepID=A0A2P2NBD0_RHIMU